MPSLRSTNECPRKLIRRSLSGPISHSQSPILTKHLNRSRLYTGQLAPQLEHVFAPEAAAPHFGHASLCMGNMVFCWLFLAKIDDKGIETFGG